MKKKLQYQHCVPKKPQNLHNNNEKDMNHNTFRTIEPYIGTISNENV